MAHPAKGSPAAKAWAAKMQAARKKAGYTRRKKNPKGDYTGVLKLPSYIDRAVAAVLHDGPRVLDWEWDRRMSPENKKHFHDFLVSVHHPLAYEAGTPEQRYKRFILEYVMPRIEKNPGEAWHEREAGYAHKYVRESKDPDEKVFYAGVESAHRISASAAKKLKMNPVSRDIETLSKLSGKTPKEIVSMVREAYTPAPRKERVIPPKHRKNPLAVFGVGNPPKRVSVGVSGVLYSRCLEIRAEKLKYKPGLYKHPFTRKAGVQILALDSGDLLVHSTRKVNLWKPV